MRFDDLEAVAQLAQSPKEKERLWQIANKLAERTTRGELSAYWWLPLEGIGYSRIGNDTACEADDVDLFNLSAFPCVKHRHSFTNYLNIELLTLVEMTRALAELFDLEGPLLLKGSVHASDGKVDLWKQSNLMFSSGCDTSLEA